MFGQTKSGETGAGSRQMPTGRLRQDGWINATMPDPRHCLRGPVHPVFFRVTCDPKCNQRLSRVRVDSLV
uniref:RES domain-containing protein n=1 Tax=Panagrellus redivivus TaxID=6233 RepID=A0A7E4UVA3_PANRE